MPMVKRVGQGVNFSMNPLISYDGFVASCGLGHIYRNIIPTLQYTNMLSWKITMFHSRYIFKGCLSIAMLVFGGYEFKSCEFSEGLLMIIIRKRWIQNDDRWMFSPDGLVVFQMSCESLSHTPILMTNVQSFYTFVCLR